MSTYYSKTHESFRFEGEEAVISITAYAIEQLGEITFVQMPEVGQHFDQGESFGEIESVKTVSELYAPLAGTVTAIHEALDETPELLNEDDSTWIIRLKADAPGDSGDAMDQAAYDAYIENLA